MTRYNRTQWLLLVAASTLLAALAVPPAAGASAPPNAQPMPPITLRVQTPDYSLDANGLRVAGYNVNTAPGAPALPVWSTLVELPATGGWSLSYETPGTQSLTAKTKLPAVPVPDVSIDGPVSWQERTDQPEPTLVDRPDPAIYAQSALYPAEAVTTSPEQWQRGRRLVAVHVFPFQYNPVTGELAYHPDVRVTVNVGLDMPASARPAGFDVPARLPEAVDGALRIYTDQRGVHRLTYSDLQTAGVPVSTANPASFAVQYLNQPVDIQVTGAADGRFDPDDLVLFYAEPYQGRYMTRNVYRFTYGGTAPGARMVERAVTPTGNEPLVTTITQTVHLERDRDYRSTYDLPDDADHWFDNTLYANVANPEVSTSYALDAGSPLQVAPGTARVRAFAYGGTSQTANPDQSIEIHLNSHLVGRYQWDGSTGYTTDAAVPAAWLDSAPNQVVLTAALSQLSGLSYYWVSPGWIDVTLPAYARAGNDRLYAEGIPVDGTHARVRVSNFTTSNVRVYDVRDPRHPVQLTTVQASALGGLTAIDFWDQWSSAAPRPSYYLSSQASLLQPVAIEADEPSSLMSSQNAADYIAIVHPSLAAAVQPLLDRRAAEGLRVKKVSVQDIYDEWSGGRVDPQAIRNFLAYAYRQWNAGGPPPRFVLLVGDGHYDFKDAAGTNLPNLIPPYLTHVDPWLGETAADSRYVSVDGPDDFLPDMSIGRIPAKTAADVTTVVDKIAAYETSSVGDWQSRAIFVADNYADPAGNFHVISDDILNNWLPAAYTGQRVYYRIDAAHDTAAKMRVAIKDAFNQGTVYLQWFGHASQFRWGSVDMFNILDPASLAATHQMPFTVHYGCWSGYFIGIQGSPQYNRNEQSLGEVLLLTPGRASVADLSPSGLHLGVALQNLDRGIVKAMFQDHVQRVGQVVDAGKLFFYTNSTGSYDLIDTSILFADPALRLQVGGASLSRLYLPALQVQ